MDLRQLRYFLTIAEEGGISSAARRLHMAQPPLSQQLKQLEQELHVQLVERGNRAIRLTDAGEILKARAEQILSMADSARREIQDYNDGLTGTLVLGAVSSSGLPNEAINAFHRRYPGVLFEIHEGNTFQMLEYLKRGRIELGIVRTPFNSVHLECRYATEEPMAAAFAGEDPFPGQDSISIADLRGRQLIIYRRFEQLVREACGEAGFEPLVCCTSDDARTAINWAKAGYGIGIAPLSALPLGGGLAGKIITSERLRTQLALIRMNGRYLSTVARRFFEQAEPIFKFR